MQIRFGQRFWLIGITCLLLALAAWPALAAGRGSLQVATAQGLLTVQGKHVLVEVLVGVWPGEDGPRKARGALRRMYPHAIEVDSEAYTLTGLVWDNFFDNDAGNDYVSVYYNSNNVPTEEGMTLGEDRLEAALDTWTYVPSSRFVFWYDGQTNRCPSLVDECRGPQRFDGYNDVGWLRISEPGVLGVTWYGLTIDEFDMALDNGSEWNWFFSENPAGIPSDAIDTETVWLHEFGHGLGLGHSDVPDAVMYAYYSEPRRSLHDDDLEGIKSLYPALSCGSDSDCDDGDPCTYDTCDSSGLCLHDPVNCNDGDACTHDICDPATGYCLHDPVNCDDGNDCTTDSCDSATGCINEPSTDPNCQCAGAGEPCAVDDDCCSLKCRGKPGSKLCRK